MSARRPPIVGRYTAEEVELATRNHGMPLEALRYDVTPAGLHYLLIHFDIPPSDEGWSLDIGGLVERPFSLSVAELRSEDSLTIRATLECAGNGRGQISPRYPSVPWLEEGVSTAEWTGVPLARLLQRARLRDGVKEIVFHGADRGFDHGLEHDFARSLPLHEAMREEVLVAHAMPYQRGTTRRSGAPCCGSWCRAGTAWRASSGCAPSRRPSVPSTAFSKRWLITSAARGGKKASPAA